jgi:hypothetical protein
MKTLILIILLILGLIFLGVYCEQNRNPYEESSHLKYSIKCENGFIFRQSNEETIQILNPDGTSLNHREEIFIRINDTKMTISTQKN